MGHKVVLAGGGTGGHVYPALAMGEAIAAKGHSLAYFGDAQRLEGRVVPERGVPFQAIPSLQYPRAGLAAKMRFAVGLLSSILTSRKLLKQHQAEFVLGVGGYISAPPVLAAWTMGIPRAIHESNVAPGLANKLCARVANQVFVAYEKSAGRLPGTAPRQVVGCPVSPKVGQGSAEQAAQRYGLAPDKPTVLVVGGSLGAATINQIGRGLVELENRAFQVIWVCGPGYEADLRNELGELGEGAVLVGYEDRMPDAYALADLIVCRAGSATLAELSVVGMPAVLVPSPNVTENHQEGNARAMEEVGAARVVVEKGFDLEAVLGLVRELVMDSNALEAMGEATRGLVTDDPAGMVATTIDGFFG